jgi:4-diphosphocytidyl-2-C-methyl-D-erythritol kinase
MPAVRVPAFAKVNLRLEILGKRPDGYHELRTIFQTISLYDDVVLLPSQSDGIELTVHGNDALGHEPARRNLVYRAVEALRGELRIRSGVRIELRKRIPAGRGLGGGSSDAAAALLGYLRLTGRKLAAERLMEIAASLGADVPFFLFGGRALGIGRGDEIYPLPDVPRRTLLVVWPQDIAVATPDAYRWLRAKRFAAPGAKLTKSGANPTLWRFCALCWSMQGGSLSNDFEAAVFRRHPRLAAIKRGLLRRGATEASLAGSGSAVFGMFQHPAEARRAALGFPNEQTLVCETVSGKRYRRALPVGQVL